MTGKVGRDVRGGVRGWESGGGMMVVGGVEL